MNRGLQGEIANLLGEMQADKLREPRIQTPRGRLSGPGHP